MLKNGKIRKSLIIVFFWGAVILLNTFLIAEEVSDFLETYPGKQIIEEIQKGGYVLYLRHGRTDSSQPDQYPIDLEDPTTQRPLTEEGRREIIAVGEAIKKAQIPIDNIYTSPLFRAKETTALAFGGDYIVEKYLMYTAHLTTAEKVPIVNKTRELLSCTDIATGKNRVLVAHAPNLADLIGYFPETEGSLIIFRPLGDEGFEYLGTILPSHWEELLN